MKKNFKLPVVVAVAAAALTVPSMAETNFSDVAANQWYTSAVESAVQNGLLSGYTDGTLRPNNTITRAEIAAVLTKAFGATEQGSLDRFKDVQYSAWYYQAMSKAVNMGVYTGDNNNNLNPNSPITREEAAVVISKAFELTHSGNDVLAKFADKNEVSTWATSFVSALVENGYMAGNEKGQLNPKGNITRAEFAQIMANITKDYIVEAGTVTTSFDGNVVVRVADVVMQNSTVGGDVVVADGVGRGEFTLDNVIVNGDLIVRGGGINSIKLLNNAGVRGKIILRNPNGATRIFADKGVIENIEVYAPVVIDAKVKNVVVNATVTVEVKDEVESMVVNAPETKVVGSGKVTTVLANANDVKVTVRKAQVTAAEGTTGVMAGNKKVEAGKTETVKLTSGGGSSSSSKDEAVEMGIIITEGDEYYSIVGECEGFVGLNGTEYEITVSGDVTVPATTVKDGETAFAFVKTLYAKLDEAKLVKTLDNKREDDDTFFTKDNYDIYRGLLKAAVEKTNGKNFKALLETEKAFEDITKVSFAEFYKVFTTNGGTVTGLLGEIEKVDGAAELFMTVYGDDFFEALLK